MITDLNKEHNEFCEGYVSCPETGKDECGKVMNWMVTDEGEFPVTVYCFGCGKTHNIGKIELNEK